MDQAQGVLRARQVRAFFVEAALTPVHPAVLRITQYEEHFSGRFVAFGRGRTAQPCSALASAPSLCVQVNPFACEAMTPTCGRLAAERKPCSYDELA